MKPGPFSISYLLLFLGLSAAESVFSQTPTPSPNSFSPDKQWQYLCPESIQYQCAPELVKAGTGETVVDLDGELNVYGKYSKRSNIAWAPDSKRFAFNFPQPASHALYVTFTIYELHGEKWERLPAKVDPIAKAISKAINRGLAAERTKKHLKAKATGAIDIVAKVHEWTDPDTALVYAYEEDGADTETVRVDFLFTLKFDKAGKLEIVKTQQLSEKERQMYGH